MTEPEEPPDRRRAQDAADALLLRAVRRARDPATRDVETERRGIALLLARYDDAIQRFAGAKGRSDGPDIAQDIRLKLVSKLTTTSAFDVPFRVVVLRCMRDIVAEHFRRQPADPTVTLEPEHLTGFAPDPAGHDTDPREDVLEEALRALGEPDATIIKMKVLNSMSAREIGAELGLSEPNVNTRYSRARERATELIRAAVRNRGRAPDEGA